MKATAELRREHARILEQASMLSGLANSRMTNEVARQTRRLIVSVDQLVVGHLMHEDQYFYPALMQAADPAVREAARGGIDDMGGILGAWVAYRDQWTVGAIQSATSRFKAATDAVIGALAMRVERENRDLYPLMDKLAAGQGDLGQAA